MRGRPPLLLLLALAALLATLMPAAGVAADRSGNGDQDGARRTSRTMTITGDALDVGRVRRGIVGGNLRWLGNADGAYDPQRDRIRSDVARLVRRIGLGSIRYPGGTIANLFDPRRAEGKPKCQVSGGLLRPLFASIPASTSGYTIGKHAQFAKEAHAATNVMVPMINMPVDRAVSYVKKVADATGQHQIYVEIGNEPYMSAQRYWRSSRADERLDQYIQGGQVQPSAPGDHGLYPVNGCNLRTPAKANGQRDQTYRPRYTPISLSTKPKIWVDGDLWTYTSGAPGRKQFTVSDDRERIIFGNSGDGLLGLAPPRGEMRMSYTAGPMPGFVDYYRALKSLTGLDVQVCSSWAAGKFVTRMDQLDLDYDCLAVHSYANTGGPTGSKSVYSSLMRAAVYQNERLTALRKQMQGSSYPGASDRFLNVTEFGGQHRKKQGPDGATFTRELVQAISLVGQVNEGVQVSNLSNFRSLLEMYGDRAALSGRAYILSLVHRLVGQQPVQVTGAPSDLTVAGTRDGGRAALLVVNRSWNSAHRVAIDLAGRTGKTCVGVRTLRADPDALTRPRTSSNLPRSVQRPSSDLWAKGSFRHTFPSHSLTLLTFQRKPATGCPRVGVL